MPTKDTNKASASPAKLVDSDLKELAQQPKKQQKMKSEDTENDVVGCHIMFRQAG